MKNYKKEYKTFLPHGIRPKFDMLISIGRRHHIESSNTDEILEFLY
jgi:hypothetical protein